MNMTAFSRVIRALLVIPLFFWSQLASAAELDPRILLSSMGEASSNKHVRWSWRERESVLRTQPKWNSESNPPLALSNAVRSALSAAKRENSQGMALAVQSVTIRNLGHLASSKDRTWLWDVWFYQVAIVPKGEVESEALEKSSGFGRYFFVILMDGSIVRREREQ